MWSLLLDWVTQEQQEGSIMAADEARPPLPPPIREHSSDAGDLIGEDSDGSGDDPIEAKLSLKPPKAIQSAVQPKTVDDLYDDNSEETEPASMAIAESLILLHPLPLTAAAAIGAAHHRTVTAGPGSVKTVFAYDDPLVEIVQLDPFVSLPSSSINQLTFVNDSVGDGFVVDPVVATAPTATTTVELLERQDAVDETTWTSNETLPPDNGEPLLISWPEGRESSSDLFNTGTPPPSSVLLSLAGNITEDILTLERWPDVVSYRGTPAPPLPPPSPPLSSFDAETHEALSSPCECVCPSPSDLDEISGSSTIAPVENTSNPVTTVATATDQPLMSSGITGETHTVSDADAAVTTTTIESPTAFSTLTIQVTTEKGEMKEGEEEEYEIVEDGVVGSTICPTVVPTCPIVYLDTATTPLPVTTPTTTTALPIPPILILEGERTDHTKKKNTRVHKTSPLVEMLPAVSRALSSRQSSSLLRALLVFFLN
jgi:hypothetical protein